MDRLSRFTANATNTGTVAGSELVLYQDPQQPVPSTTAARSRSATTESCYFTTGEHFTPGDAQDFHERHAASSTGSTRTATIPTDDPFYDGAGPNCDSIWALGSAEPVSCFVRRSTGRLYIGDVGGNDNSTAVEEVDIGAAGANYGWPDHEGPCPAPCTSPLYSYPHNWA